MAVSCQGTAAEHCCWVGGAGVCEFFDSSTVDSGKGCTLRTELGSWAAVAADPRYRQIHEVLVRIGVERCDEWPRPDEVCHACGAVG